MKKNIIIIILAVTFFSLAGYFILLRLSKARTDSATFGLQKTVSDLKLESDYESEVVAVLKDFSVKYQIAGEPEQKSELAKSTRQKILDVRVPAQYKDLHLNLVLALGAMAD